MEINPQRSPTHVPATTARKRVGKSKRPLSEQPSVAFLGSALLEAIEAGLDALPEIRPERLSEGKDLASDPDYPTEDQLTELSQLALQTYRSSMQTNANEGSMDESDL